MATRSLTTNHSRAATLRARDWGIRFDGTPGLHNAITDVRGVEVGHTTLIRGAGRLIVGRGPVRTGVTAILPRGRADDRPLFAAIFSHNGNGEMTGSHWVEESGVLSGPIMLTNTHSVGVIHDAVIAWQVRRRRLGDVRQKPLRKLLNLWSLPVVAETWDGVLNDVNGFHVKPRHAWRALEAARGGRVAEGCVGGGTGMIGFGWKGGIGTASRKLERRAGGFALGVLVQLNCGRADQLTVGGVPIGRDLPHPGRLGQAEHGSIIIVIATDAPILAHQLKRIARRATMGLARTGATSGNGSGDIFIAFSTANAPTPAANPVSTVRMLDNWRMDPLFDATVQATEEAIVNALCAARGMTGPGGIVVPALPRADVQRLLARERRLAGR
jgi:L-aminopeptidase/D-esterase-like protein